MVYDGNKHTLGLGVWSLVVSDILHTLLNLLYLLSWLIWVEYVLALT
jgi:hypothetical protein